MKIYTSYYARANRLKERGIIPVCISLGEPRWLPNIECIKDFAPDRKTLSLGQAGDTKGYYDSFMAKLDNLNLEELESKLRRISEKYNDAPIALCCYEKVTDFCHRDIVADFLNKKLNLDVKEFGEERSYGGVMMIQKSFWV